MTLESQDSSSDAINKFKKRKHEEHKANRVSNKYPEGFGGDDASYNKPAKRFESGDPKGSFRGGSRGSFRGGSRGSFRGGSRGSFRGGSRGSFRGGSRGSFRGSSRGDSRGSFRGGSRGSFRGDSRGSFRGSSRGSFKGGVNREAESNQPDEKTDWKKYKEDKKEVRLQRLKNKGDDSYELGVKAKKIWEELRQGNCKGAKREELCNKLMSLVQGKVKSLVFAHDTVRVIETLMAVGDEKHRSLLFNELKDCVVELSKSKFARFFVLKTLKYGTKEEKNQIIVTLRGHVVKLMRHKTASDIVELAYNDYANAKQRSMFVQEFYGPEFRLFHDENIQCLDDALKKHPEKREYILKDMRKNLQPIIEKGVFTNTMVHTLIRDYLTHCDAEFRTAIIETLREGLAPILHTRDGSRVAMLCLWHGTNRDRKVILKSFRTHYIKIALENHGHMVLLAAFDCMDDTEFMKKAVLNELMEELPQLVSSDSGMKVLRYLIAPRSPLFFHPCIVKVLEQGDGNEASKKDVTLRREELQRAVRTPILRLLLANLKSWSVNPNWTLFIGASLNSLGAIEGKTIFEQLAQMFAEEYIPGCEGHVLDIAHTIKMVTYIIRGDKKREEENKTTFCSYLVKSAESELPGWINCNRGCFLLVNLIETDIEDIVLKVKRLITPLKDKLSTLDTKGAEILLQKL